MTGAVGTTDTEDSTQEQSIGYLPGEEPEIEVADSQSPDEAEASFAKGFESISGGEQAIGSHLRPSDKPVETPPAEPEAEPSASADSAPVAAPGNADELEDVRKRMRKLEGRVGTLNSDLSVVKAERNELKQRLEQGGQTAQERDETLKHLKEIDESIQEFRELAPVKAELETVYERISELEQRLPIGSGSADVAEQVGKELLYILHDDWEEVSATPEFRGFVLKGGPSEQEYLAYARLVADQQSPGYEARLEQSDSILAGWEEDFPEWWDDRGRRMFKGDTRDSIKILDRFKDASEASQQRREISASQQQSMQARLRRSAPTRGVDAPPVTGVSDEEAFNRGFSKGRRYYTR